MLRLRILGPWQAEYDDLSITSLPTRHARALVARLAMAYPRPLTRARLYHDLLPGVALESAAHTLRTTLYYVRRTVPNLLHVDDDLVGLVVTDVNIDVWQFERWSEAGATQSMLERAIELYRGPLLAPGEVDGWAREERERLARRYVDALQRLVALSATSGQTAVWLHAAQRWAREEPWNDDAALAVVEASIAAGDTLGAQTATRIARTLVGESGSREALARLDALERAVTRPMVRAPSYGSHNSPPPMPNLGRLPLVGRTHELAALRASWDATTSGPHVLTIVGEAGSGKSRLLHELVRHVRTRPDAIALVGHQAPHASDRALGELRSAFAHPSAHDQEALRRATAMLSDRAWSALAGFPEFHALLPDRPILPATPLDTASEIARREAAAVEFLTGIATDHPLLLALDAADPATHETERIIAALMARPYPILVIRTERTTDRGSSTGTALTLTPLSMEAMRTLLNHMLEGRVTPTVSQRLLAWSEGNPLRLRMHIRRLIDQGQLVADMRGRWALMDAGCSPALYPAFSWHSLPSHTRDLAAFVVLLERPVERTLLAALMSRETLDEALIYVHDQHIVRESEHGIVLEDAWQRDTMLESLDDAGRRALHARIAIALHADPASDSAETMRHAALARLWEIAAATALDTAERARAQHEVRAMASALDIAEQALHALCIAPNDARWWQWLSLREHHAAATDRGAAWLAALHALARFARTHKREDWLVDALVRQGRAFREQGRLSDAEPVLQSAAEQAADAGLHAAEARARTSLAAVLEDRGAVREAMEHQRQAVVAAKRCADPALLTHTLGVLAYMQMRAGDLQAALDVNTSLLEAPTMGEHPLLEARFGRHQGIILLASRRFEQGMDWLRRSIAQSQTIGDLYGLLTGQTSLIYYSALLGIHAQHAALDDVLVEQARREDARTHLCWLLLAQARAAAAVGDGAAVALALEGAHMGETAGDDDGTAACYALAARQAHAERRTLDALDLIERATQYAGRVERPTTIVAHVAAQVWLANGDEARAHAAALAAIRQARTPGLASVYAIEALYDTARVLAHTSSRSEGQVIRAEAYQLLAEDVSEMQSAAFRRAYLHASPAHSALAASAPSGSLRLTILPLRSAPRGRALHPHEITPVVWTIHDQAPTAAGRREQIRALVYQAQAQGATATVDALARALAVAPRTIQRDLDALRRAGHSVDTRGSTA